jgi:hypothetical protein
LPYELSDVGIPREVANAARISFVDDTAAVGAREEPSAESPDKFGYLVLCAPRYDAAPCPHERAAAGVQQ